MKRTLLPPVLYSAALLPLVVASYAAAAGAFEVYERLPDSIQKSDWIGVVLNDVAPGSAGVICVPLLVDMLARRSAFAATLAGFVTRTAPWITVASFILLIVWRERANSDFGLWSQIITWPLAALVAGIVTDALVTWRGASVSPAV